ncbi:MAG: type II secretion system F family protein [Actinobacteria bacterium]|nr:type II secretion system F family protein [Actinomycetota bacterium]MDQ3531061.1 type II secretion system F family protein [Actinomycetota bacterium]
MRVLMTVVGALGLLLLFDGLTTRERRRKSPLLRRLDRLADESGMQSMTGVRLIGASVASGLAVYFVVAALTSSSIESVVISAVAASLPVATARARRKRRLRRFREAWPDAIAILISGIRAGVSLPESCLSLVIRGPRELQPGFAAFTSTYRSSGSFRAGLTRLAAEMADPVADRVVTALVLAHEVGGTDLVRVLRTLGDFVREDLKVRQEIEARWSWTVTAARVAAAAPWLVLVMMSTRPETAMAYNSPSGVVVILIGAAATGLGYALMLRAARLPTERRLGA